MYYNNSMSKTKINTKKQALEIIEKAANTWYSLQNLSNELDVRRVGNVATEIQRVLNRLQKEIDKLEQKQ